MSECVSMPCVSGIFLSLLIHQQLRSSKSTATATATAHYLINLLSSTICMSVT